jgi:hypothetical protein
MHASKTWVNDKRKLKILKYMEKKNNEKDIWPNK